MVVLAFGANGSPGGGSGFGVAWKNPTTPRPGTSGTGGDLQSGTSGSACAAGAATTPTINDIAATASATSRRRRALPPGRELMTCSQGCGDARRRSPSVLSPSVLSPSVLSPSVLTGRAGPASRHRPRAPARSDAPSPPRRPPGRARQHRQPRPARPDEPDEPDEPD